MMIGGGTIRVTTNHMHVKYGNEELKFEELASFGIFNYKNSQSFQIRCESSRKMFIC